MVDAINQAQAERTAAQAQIDNAQTSEAALDVAEVYAMIDSLGDVSAVITDAKPASLQRLYQALNVEVQYEPEERAAYLTATPRVDGACVRGGIEHEIAAYPRLAGVHALYATGIQQICKRGDRGGRVQARRLAAVADLVVPWAERTAA
jgi:hypothetical protein